MISQSMDVCVCFVFLLETNKQAKPKDKKTTKNNQKSKNNNNKKQHMVNTSKYHITFDFAHCNKIYYQKVVRQNIVRLNTSF